MNYEVLVSELSNDPTGIGYSGMTDEEVAVAINANTQTSRQTVPLWQIKKLAIESNLWLTIKQAAVEHVSNDIKNVAIIALDYINDTRFSNLDMDLVSTQTMLGALVAGGVITQDFVDELNVLANTLTSRASILGLGGLSSGHIASARKMIVEE